MLFQLGNGNFKLLGIPIISKSASDAKVGSLIGESVYDLVNQWQCAKKVVAMVCDTTSSNTGHLTTACIAMQQKLQKLLLHVAPCWRADCVTCIQRIVRIQQGIRSSTICKATESLSPAC
jgi:hypothetical protein